MSTRELAYSMIDNLTEEQLNAIVVILRGLQGHGNDDELLSRIKDSESGKNMHGPFDSFDEFWEDLNAED